MRASRSSQTYNGRTASRQYDISSSTRRPFYFTYFVRGPNGVTCHLWHADTSRRIPSRGSPTFTGWTYASLIRVAPVPAAHCLRTMDDFAAEYLATSQEPPSSSGEPQQGDKKDSSVLRGRTSLQDRLVDKYVTRKKRARSNLLGPVHPG